MSTIVMTPVTLTNLSPDAVNLLLHEHGGQGLMHFHPQGYRHDSSRPLHEVHSLEVQQHELLGGALKGRLLPQNAEQGKHHF